MSKINFKEEDLLEMKRLYEVDLWSTARIGKKYNTSDNTIASRLRSLGADVTRRRSKKITNRYYFSNIDSERKAYFLGLIIADGSVVLSKGKYSFRIELIETDRYLIEELVSDLGGRIDDIKTSIRAGRNPTSYWAISDKYIINDLAKYGVIPNKTHSAYLPEVNTELVCHLIRGIFDGDGTVYVSNGYVRTAFYGSRSVVTSIRDILCERLGMNALAIVDRGNHFSIHPSCQKFLVNFYNYCYLNSSLKMFRKNNILAALASNGQ